MHYLRLIATTALLTSLTACQTPTATPAAVVTTPAVAVWASAWADAPSEAGGPASSEQTFRIFVKPSVSSRGTVRLHFSNYFGSAPITIGAVHIAVQSTGSAVTNDVAVSFAGVSSVTIPAHGYVTSDSTQFAFKYGQVLGITEYVTGAWTTLTGHSQNGSNVTSYSTASKGGNQTADLSGASFNQLTPEAYLLDRVDVLGDYKGTIAAFGGSTTDGVNSGLDLHMTYPEQLAAALQAAGRDDVGVANAGIAGNQLLGTDTTSGASRFSRDVLALPNVLSVIDYIGANDLRNSCVTAAALISGQQSLIAQAHQAGLKVYAATIAPSTFCGSQNPGGYGSRFGQGTGEEAQRFLLNTWYASTQTSVVGGISEPAPQADALIDFSAALSDPANLSYMLPALNSGDDIHPNPAGYAAMASRIRLSLF